MILMNHNQEYRRGIYNTLTITNGDYQIQDCKDVKEMEDVVSNEGEAIFLIIINIEEYMEALAGIVFWLRKQENAIWIAGISEEINSVDLVECFRLGIIDFIGKPFSVERMKHILQKALKIQELKLNSRMVAVNELDYLCLHCCCSGMDIERMLPKGYNQKTYKRIFNYLAQSASRKFTSLELAQELGLSRITARRYLDLLEMTNKIEMEMSYGKAGRPTNRYRFKIQSSES